MIETRTETSVVAVKSTFDMATIADVLTADSDSAGDRILALDEYHTDYSMTRDCSVIFAGSKIHRYSCKDPWKYTEQKELEGSFDHRKATLPFYETWVIGQVHDATSFSKYRIFDSNEARDCYVVSLKCPDSADSESKGFFGKQIAALENIMKVDGVDPTGTDGWLGPCVNDARIIKVTLTEDAMGFWNSGWWAFLPDQYVKMLVWLRRDDGFRGKIHTYTAWLEEFALVDEEDLVE